MAESLDTVSKQLSSSIEIKRGIAAMLADSADTEQSALEACQQAKVERDMWKAKYEEEHAARMRAEEEIARLQQIVAGIPRYQFKDCDIHELTTGNKVLNYGQDISNQRQLDQRVGAGRETHSLCGERTAI